MTYKNSKVANRYTLIYKYKRDLESDLQKKYMMKKTREPTFKTFYSRNNRHFRLSGINETHATIKWLDTNQFEKFEYNKINPYLR